MKFLSPLSRFFCVILCAWTHTALGTVISNDATIIPDILGAASPNSQVLTLSQSIPTGQGLFAIEIAPVTSEDYRFSYLGIAELYRLFTVAPGLQLDSSFVVANTPVVTNTNAPGSYVQRFALNESIYFGYWDDRNNGQVDNSDLYGWVLITRNDSGLVATSGATALGGGIIVGTTTQIPEPSAGMLLLALAVGGLRRRRN